MSEPENAGQLAEFLQRIDTEPGLRERLVLGGGEVVKRHSWAEAARRYLALYDEVLVERGAGGA